MKEEREALLSEYIGLALGGASTCWEDLTKAGVFKAEEALKIHKHLLGSIKSLYADVEEKAWMYDDLCD